MGSSLINGAVVVKLSLSLGVWVASVTVSSYLKQMDVLFLLRIFFFETWRIRFRMIRFFNFSTHSKKFSSRAGTGTKFSGFELFRVSILGPELWSCSQENWLKPQQALEIVWAFLDPYISCFLLSPVALLKKAYGLGQDLGLGSIGYWAFLLRGLLQAEAFKL